VLLDLFGGHQSARTLHFAAFVVLMLFFVAHVVMVIRSGLGRQVRAMTVGDRT
jgi:thiosulfate reductase cytochrome b subunit